MPHSKPGCLAIPMPELPEVETSRRGIEPHILGQRVSDVIIRQNKLRWPVSASIKKMLPSQLIRKVDRRGKYLLVKTDKGTLIIHLGMSGSLRILPADSAAEKHDHFEIQFENGKALRLRDPRRFGAVLWTTKDPLQHKLLKQLGPEPLSDLFNTDYLYTASRNRKVAIKTLVMNSHIVVGVGNIYASESLFLAGINPKRSAHRISKLRYEKLVAAIKTILQKAIEQGGTTLRDFTQEDGKPGYFQQTLAVYGRQNQPCRVCGTPIKQFTQAQRSTYYCPQCQK